MTIDAHLSKRSLMDIQVTGATIVRSYIRLREVQVDVTGGAGGEHVAPGQREARLSAMVEDE